MQGTRDAIAELFEHAPCGLVLTSSRGEILAVNDTLLELLERSRSEVVGATFSQLMNVAGRIYYETHIAPLLHMQGHVSEVAVELVRNGGAEIPVFLSATQAIGSGEDDRAIRIAMFHAADRRKYERELLLARRMAEQGLKAKSDFLAVFAHEIRNGLNGVQLAATLLQRASLPAVATKPLATLHSSLHRVVDLLQNMLDLSAVEAGMVELHRGRFDLRDLLCGVLRTVEPVAEHKGLAIECAIGERLPRPAGRRRREDRPGDRQPRGKRGEVHGSWGRSCSARISSVARTATATIRFRVKDSGIGIPPDRIAGSGTSSRQGGPEIREHYGGSGLGLAISRRIVELHGSRIQVESAPGSGTEFWFDLTLPEASMASATG